MVVARPGEVERRLQKASHVIAAGNEGTVVGKERWSKDAQPCRRTRWSVVCSNTSPKKAVWRLTLLSLHTSRATPCRQSAARVLARRPAPIPSYSIVLSTFDGMISGMSRIAFDKSVDNDPIIMYTFAQRQRIALNTLSASSTLAQPSL